MVYYLDIFDGDDANDGQADTTPVKTSAQALTLAASGGDTVRAKVGDEPEWLTVFVRRAG